MSNQTGAQDKEVGARQYGGSRCILAFASMAGLGLRDPFRCVQAESSQEPCPRRGTGPAVG